MEELIPNSIDASKEKHVPVITTNGNVCKVSIGSIAHPMEQAHYIMWVILLTNKGYYKKDLNPNDLPEVTFNLDNDEKVSKQYNKNYKTI